jgi:TonB family protein
MSLEPKRLCLVPLLLVGLSAAGAQDADPSLCDLALAGRAEAVRTLLDEGAQDVDSADATGWTALMYAVKGGHDEIVEMLLAAGAAVHARNDSQETALHLAARHGRTDAAQSLLRAGADIELRDSEERTPLYRAVERRRAAIIEMLQQVAQARAHGAPSQTTSESRDHALPARIIEATEAPYTESALAEGIEGTVVLMVLVRRDGSVGAASVSKGLEASLDASAARTVEEWKFAPAMRNGKTVEIVVEVEIEFELPSDR